MTLPIRLVGGPGVKLLQPQIVQTITYASVTTATITHSTITVPFGLLRNAHVFMPPGVNYAVRMQLGFNGQVQIPSTNTSDYIIGCGYQHDYPWGIQVARSIDVWAWHWNANPHTVYVRLDVDVGIADEWAKPLNPVSSNPLRLVV